MKFLVFFAQRPIFTIDEVFAFASKNATHSCKESTIYNLLSYHQSQGHIVRIHRGLYYTIPYGMPHDHFPMDPFLIASKMAGDAVIGYLTALDFFGKLRSVLLKFIYISKKREPAPFIWQGVQYKGVSIPTNLKKTHSEQFGVLSTNRLGQKILITSLERTLVDILDRPALCGSWEEIWTSLENIEYLDLDQVFQYAKLLAKRTIFAKLGFFLESHREQLMVPDSYVAKLRKYIPKKPFYLDKRERNQKMLSQWNLIVPLGLLQREWEEV